MNVRGQTERRVWWWAILCWGWLAVGYLFVLTFWWVLWINVILHGPRANAWMLRVWPGVF